MEPFGLKIYSAIPNPVVNKFVRIETKYFSDIEPYLDLNKKKLTDLSCVAGMSTVNVETLPHLNQICYVLPPNSHLTIYEAFTHTKSIMQLYDVIKILINAHQCEQTPLIYFFRETSPISGSCQNSKMPLYELSWVISLEGRACVFLVQILRYQIIIFLISLLRKR